MPFYLLDNVLPFAEIALVQLRPRSSVMPFIQRRTDCIFVPNIICEYLDEICAKPSPLLSFDPYLRAVQRQWANFASSNLLPLVSAALATASADHAALLLALKSVNKALHELSDSGPFFCGKAFTLVCHCCSASHSSAPLGSCLAFPPSRLQQHACRHEPDVERCCRSTAPWLLLCARSTN